MNFVGADAAELEALAVAYEQTADVLERMRRSMTSSVHSAPWEGGSVDRFRYSWDHTHQRSLFSAVSTLHQAAGVLRKNAEQQRAASGEAPKPEHHWWEFVGAEIAQGLSALKHEAEAAIQNAAAGVQAIAESAHNIIVSDTFKQVIDFAGTVGTTASLIAPFVMLVNPGLGAAVYAVAGVAQGIALVGKGLRAANGNPDSYTPLGFAVDLAGVGLSVAGFGTARALAAAGGVRAVAGNGWTMGYVRRYVGAFAKAEDKAIASAFPTIGRESMKFLKYGLGLVKDAPDLVQGAGRVAEDATAIAHGDGSRWPALVHHAGDLTLKGIDDVAGPALKPAEDFTLKVGTSMIDDVEKIGGIE